MSLICKKCGKKVDNWVPQCPFCSAQDFALKSYARTLTVSGSTVTAFNHLIYAKNMLESAMSASPNNASFITPIIDQLEKAADVTKKQNTEFATSKKTELKVYETKINELTKLIERKPEEGKFQRFFEENPNFLNSCVKESFPKKSLGGEGFPDFILELTDSSYLIIEIEKPDTRLFNKKGDQAGEFTHAQQQIRDYLRWAIEEKEYLRKRGLPNINADNAYGLLVIGHQNQLDKVTTKKFNNIVAEVRGKYDIKTFDQVLEKNETNLKNLRNMSN